ncbi:hypothetical protein CGRA01v4_14486 [Colletotrichum graminicola]|nr:hypothetical protein CGRA01v4_14486 [Colletotrichum graminicola]
MLACLGRGGGSDRCNSGFWRHLFVVGRRRPALSRYSGARHVYGKSQVSLCVCVCLSLSLPHRPVLFLIIYGVFCILAHLPSKRGLVHASCCVAPYCAVWLACSAKLLCTENKKFGTPAVVLQVPPPHPSLGLVGMAASRGGYVSCPCPRTIIFDTDSTREARRIPMDLDQFTKHGGPKISTCSAGWWL